MPVTSLLRDYCNIPNLTRVVQSNAPMLRLSFARKSNYKNSALSVTSNVQHFSIFLLKYPVYGLSNPASFII